MIKKLEIVCLHLHQKLKTQHRKSAGVEDRSTVRDHDFWEKIEALVDCMEPFHQVDTVVAFLVNEWEEQACNPDADTRLMHKVAAEGMVSLSISLYVEDSLGISSSDHWIMFSTKRESH